MGDRGNSKEESSGDVSLSIDETNALRIKLGMKPLDMKPSREKQEVDRWKERADMVEQDAESAKLMSKIFEQKDRRKIKDRLKKIKKLAESDSEDEVDDALAWIKKSRRLQQEKEQAELQAKQYEDMEDEFGLGSMVADTVSADQSKRDAYTSSDLKGLKVQHDMDQFNTGTTILTIEDTDILKDEDDVLVNVNMVDDTATKERNDMAKLKPGYNAYDDDQFDEKSGQTAPKKGVLAKYDEEIDGKAAKNLVLGEYGVVGRDEDAERRQKVLAELKKSAQSVQDIAVSARADAYTTEEMVAFKKPTKKKKKKTKSRRMRADDLLDNQDLSIPEGGDVNDEAAPRKWGMKASDLDAGEDDDDELRLALERTRRQKSRANTENSLESISAALAQRRKDESSRTDYAKSNGTGLTISANVESIRSLGAVPTAQRKMKPEPTTDNAQPTIKEEPVATDMMDVDASIDEPTEKKSAWTGVGQTIKEEPSAHVRIPEAEIKQEPESDTEEFTLLEETKLARGGMMAALNFAKERGMIDRSNGGADGGKVMIDDAQARARERAKAEEKGNGNASGDYRTEREKERDKYRHRGGDRDRDARDRDWDRDRDRDRDRRGGGTFEELRDYNPDSKLEYYDESGHTIDVKEAFRQLSYKFHGIKPGKAKIEKMMKKRAEQLSLNKMSNTDTPLDTVDKLRRKNEATGSAYVVLSGQQNLDLKKMGKKREADRESKTGPSGAATKKAKK